MNPFRCVFVKYKALKEKYDCFTTYDGCHVMFYCITLRLPAMSGNSIHLLQAEVVGKCRDGCIPCSGSFISESYHRNLRLQQKKLVLLVLRLLCEWVNMKSLLAVCCCIIVFERVFISKPRFKCSLQNWLYKTVIVWKEF